MAQDVILLGEVAERGAAMIEVRCGRCERAGRLSVARLLAEHGPNTSMGEVMRAQGGDCPHRYRTVAIPRSPRSRTRSQRPAIGGGPPIVAAFGFSRGSGSREVSESTPPRRRVSTLEHAPAAGSSGGKPCRKQATMLFRCCATTILRYQA